MNERLTRSALQQRSQLTTMKFVSAASKLLENKTFAELSVAEIAATAKRSVGSFYQRFGGKEQFLKILIQDFLESGVDERATPCKGRNDREIYAEFLADTYRRIRRNRNLWHAALELSSSDPTFWSEFASLRTRRLEMLIEALEAHRGGKKLSSAEYRRFAVAGQVFNSVINNQIINSPGPLSLEDDEFLPAMTKIVLQVAGLAK